MRCSISLETNYAAAMRERRVISDGRSIEQPHPSSFVESLKRSASLIASPDKHIGIMMEDRAA